MNHHYDRLPTVVAKLQRADEHIAQLKAEVALFEREDTYGEIVNDDPNIIQAFVERWNRRGIPPRFGVIVGEIIYLLRSSLDHAIEALILRDNGSPSGKSGFPAWNRPPTTPKELRIYQAQIDGIRRKKVLRIIHRHQPFTRKSATSGKKWLATMNAMGNTDKHHGPILVIAHMDPRVQIATRYRGRYIGESDMRDHGEPFAPTLPIPPHDHEILNVKRTIRPYIAFTQFANAPYPLPVALTLEQMKGGICLILDELCACL